MYVKYLNVQYAYVLTYQCKIIIFTIYTNDYLSILFSGMNINLLCFSL